MKSALATLKQHVSPARSKSNAPKCASFAEFLRDHARVLQRDGSGGPFSTAGRARWSW
jgi:hypothetical protein